MRFVIEIVGENLKRCIVLPLAIFPPNSFYHLFIVLSWFILILSSSILVTKKLYNKTMQRHLGESFLEIMIQVSWSQDFQSTLSWLYFLGPGIEIIA